MVGVTNYEGMNVNNEPHFSTSRTSHFEVLTYKCHLHMDNEKRYALLPSHQYLIASIQSFKIVQIPSEEAEIWINWSCCHLKLIVHLRADRLTFEGGVGDLVCVRNFFSSNLW